MFDNVYLKSKDRRVSDWMDGSQSSQL